MRLKSKNYSLNGWDVFMVQIFALHYWQQAYLVKSHTVNKIVCFNIVQTTNANIVLLSFSDCNGIFNKRAMNWIKV